MVFAGTQNQPEKTKKVIFLPTPQNEKIVNKVIENIELKKLADIENISVRTYNICAYNDLLDLGKILQYFWVNGDFKKIRNCGNNSNQELINICNKYQYLISKTDNNTRIPSPKSEITEIIESLTAKQKAVLNNIVSAKFNNLSQRSRHALSNCLNHTITIKSLKEYIFSDINFEISSLKNIGSKASDELNLFLNEIKDFIKLVAIFENEEDLTRELLNAILINLFSVAPKTIAKIGENYDFSDGIPIFKTINILIENDFVFKKKEKVVFKHSLGFYENEKPLTLEKTGTTIGITRERTRQIRNRLLENFNQYFSFVGFFEKENLNFYSLDTTASLLDIDKIFIGELSHNENVNYNKFFINRIFSILLKDKYFLIGNEKKGVLGYSSRNHHNWNSTYLISNHIHSIFDFDKLTNDISVRLSKKIEEDYKFHFQTYLLNFKKDDCFVFLDEISQIAEQILYNEFEIIIDIDENITFSRNSNKTIVDYIYNILSKVKKPLTVYEIFDILNRQYPGISKSAEALRGSCQRDNRLIYFGRSSTYGLKIWEEKLENIKGGTMHDIAEEYLLKFDEPKHINEIAEYVKSFRKNVTAKNLFYNLKSAEHRRFIFFKKRFIGLTSKEYDSDLFSAVLKNEINKKSWEDNFESLKDYVMLNKCLPSSIGSDQEKKLYRFFNLQTRNIERLEKNKRELLENFLTLIDYKKRESKKDEQYEILLSFIIHNGRMPSSQQIDEKKIHRFLYKQQILYQNNRLPKKYLPRFLEIVELIKNIAR